MSKPGFFWNDKKGRLALIIDRRFRNTSSRPIMTEEVSKSWMKLSNIKEEKFIVLIKETNNSDEINHLFMNNYWNKFGIFVKLMRKVSRDGRIVANSRVYIRYNCEEKVGRRSRHYPWTHSVRCICGLMCKCLFSSSAWATRAWMMNVHQDRGLCAQSSHDETSIWLQAGGGGIWCVTSHLPPRTRPPFEVYVRLTASSLARTWSTGIFQSVCASSGSEGRHNS